MGNVYQNTKVVLTLSPAAYERWDALTDGLADEPALEAIEAKVAVTPGDVDALRARIEEMGRAQRPADEAYEQGLAEGVRQSAEELNRLREENGKLMAELSELRPATQEEPDAQESTGRPDGDAGAGDAPGTADGIADGDDIAGAAV